MSVPNQESERSGQVYVWYVYRVCLLLYLFVFEFELYLVLIYTTHSSKKMIKAKHFKQTIEQHEPKENPGARRR